MGSNRSSRTDKAIGVVLGDIHAPFTDPKAWAWALKNVEQERKRASRERARFYLFAGNDWVDASPVSPFVNEDQHGQEEEYQCAARQSRELRMLVGEKATLVRLEGNHDKRLEGDRPNVPRRLRALCHWSRDPDLGPEWKKWQTVPYIKSKVGSVRVGQVVVYHGFETSGNSDETEGLQMAWLHGGLSHLLTVRGHTHRPLSVTQSYRTRKVPLAHWYANCGHLGPRQPEWAYKDNTSVWGQALVVFDTRLGDLGRMNGKCWDAETRIFTLGPG